MTPLAKNNLAAPDIRLGDWSLISQIRKNCDILRLCFSIHKLMKVNRNVPNGGLNTHNNFVNHIHETSNE